MEIMFEVHRPLRETMPDIGMRSFRLIRRSKDQTAKGNH